MAIFEQELSANTSDSDPRLQRFTPDTLLAEVFRRVEAGEPLPTHAELRAGLKAGIKSRRPEPATTGNQSAPKATAPSLREEILACFDDAISLIHGKNPAALEALESAKTLVATLSS